MRRRPASRAPAVAAVVLAVLLLWSPYVPLPGGRHLDVVLPFTQLVALRPPLAVAVLLLGAAALARAVRRRRGVVPALLVVVLAGGAALQVAARTVGAGRPGPSAVAVTVLTANTARSSVRPATLAALVDRTGARVVALPETNRDAARAIAAELTRTTGRPWRAFGDATAWPDDATSAKVTALVVAGRLRPRALPAATPPGSHGQVRVRLDALGVSVAAVHPVAPPPGGSQGRWRTDLLALRGFCRDAWIVAGDLNATIDHSPLRAVLHAGCEDAARAAGRGLRATWSGGPLGLVRPQLDHVLLGGGWRADRAGVLALPGSDHRAVWARVGPA
ncbi:endonuclease/exonuclease/phosphatase family protein [Patulibacter sp. SYSU D01012]|uniref:endonuclease/exonuclease/phosphatase family protein n=1 Tax=Patulibacter sp. SYSU D01012 TaxID=2817381 RepID=UPI001B309F42|nr:endonuclease/exonuclease/phosphatase family protein [Patulibacter sp. SYSU D01012]